MVPTLRPGANFLLPERLRMPRGARQTEGVSLRAHASCRAAPLDRDTTTRDEARLLGLRRDSSSLVTERALAGGRARQTEGVSPRARASCRARALAVGRARQPEGVSPRARASCRASRFEQLGDGTRPRWGASATNRGGLAASARGLSRSALVAGRARHNSPPQKPAARALTSQRPKLPMMPATRAGKPAQPPPTK
jgi:hypothetical protein